MRTILLVAALAACGGESAHDVIDCASGAWAGVESATKCERACATGPACAANDTACFATLPMCKQPDGRLECSANHIAADDGTFGCCQPDRPNTLVFVECESE